LCDGRPSHNGLVVPYVTVIDADGTPLFGEIIKSRVNDCMARRRCQLCGTRADGPAVFVVPRPVEVVAAEVAIVTGSAPYHPDCADYALATWPEERASTRVTAANYTLTGTPGGGVAAVIWDPVQITHVTVAAAL
jgi:hypothetical protein